MNTFTIFFVCLAVATVYGRNPPVDFADDEESFRTFFTGLGPVVNYRFDRRSYGDEDIFSDRFIEEINRKQNTWKVSIIKFYNSRTLLYVTHFREPCLKSENIIL